jgi:hypothetical protein
VSNAEPSPAANPTPSEPSPELAPTPVAPVEDLWAAAPTTDQLDGDRERLNLASASLRNTLARYQTAAPTILQEDVQILQDTLAKLDGSIYCIAAFGLVSRGKSAVLNALLGEKV